MCRQAYGNCKHITISAQGYHLKKHIFNANYSLQYFLFSATKHVVFFFGIYFLLLMSCLVLVVYANKGQWICVCVPVTPERIIYSPVEIISNTMKNK